MPIFKKIDSQHYLMTNYKVMYSTLNRQHNLLMVRIDLAMKYDILLNWLSLSPSKFYFISRNPYDRIESFFKDKFRNAVDYYERNGYWQHSQKLFFPYLGIDESLSPDIIKQRLFETAFKDIIAVLPNVYLKDKHLHPQWHIKSIMVKNIKVPIKVVRVFKMESEIDLQQLQTVFKIDITSKVNSTKEITDEVIWTESALKIVESLYKKDFKAFQYIKR